MDSLSPITPTVPAAARGSLGVGEGRKNGGVRVGANGNGNGNGGAGVGMGEGEGEGEGEADDPPVDERSVLLISRAPGEDFVLDSAPSSAVDPPPHGSHLPRVASPTEE